MMGGKSAQEKGDTPILWRELMEGTKARMKGAVSIAYKTAFGSPKAACLVSLRSVHQTISKQNHD